MDLRDLSLMCVILAEVHVQYRHGKIVTKKCIPPPLHHQQIWDLIMGWEGDSMHVGMSQLQVGVSGN